MFLYFFVDFLVRNSFFFLFLEAIAPIEGMVPPRDGPSIPSRDGEPFPSDSRESGDLSDETDDAGTPARGNGGSSRSRPRPAGSAVRGRRTSSRLSGRVDPLVTSAPRPRTPDPLGS